ncbi:indolepyruvate ferredoxin oxidoreductase subunit alpha [Pseudonocardia xishanensis]|uniref:Ferredoxin n=1 Tax=Pseudonocardia xishanensis TaxID=630995 RepID=A0ABP8S4W9_9PSEU
MTFVIGSACIDVLDKSCMEVCPVDCIYVGARKAYIDAAECIDCSACLGVCPADAVYSADDAGATPDGETFVADSRTFFDSPLPGRAAPVGDPGGALLSGDIGVDTPLVASYPVEDGQR